MWIDRSNWSLNRWRTWPIQMCNAFPSKGQLVGLSICLWKTSVANDLNYKSALLNTWDLTKTCINWLVSHYRASLFIYNTSSVHSFLFSARISSTQGLFVFHLALLNTPLLPQGSVHSQLTKRVKHYNYCRCWNVDHIFLKRRLPLGYICNTFLLATRQLFPSSAHFSSTVELVVREYALMLKVSQHFCANMKQMIRIDHIFTD